MVDPQGHGAVASSEPRMTGRITRHRLDGRPLSDAARSPAAGSDAGGRRRPPSRSVPTSRPGPSGSCSATSPPASTRSRRTAATPSSSPPATPDSSASSGCCRHVAWRYDVFPAASSVATLCARAGMPWDDAVVLSAHGRGDDGLRRAVNACRALAQGRGADRAGRRTGRARRRAHRPPRPRCWSASNLGTGEESVTSCTPDEAAARAWAEPERRARARATPSAERSWAHPGRQVPQAWALAEEAFEHRDSMVTKAEVRALVLARLGPGLGDLVWDIGCGSGSVAIECARFGAAVSAVDADAAQTDRTARNAAAHSVAVHVVHGQAPEALRRRWPTRTPSSSAAAAAHVDCIAEAAAAREPARHRRRARRGRSGRRRACCPAQQAVIAPTASSSPRPGSPRCPATRPGSPRRTRSSCCGASDDRARHGDGRRTRGRRSASPTRWPDTRSYPVGDLATAWAECDALVCFLAVGATVRLLAPAARRQDDRPGGGVRRRGRPVRRRRSSAATSRRERARRAGRRSPRRRPPSSRRPPTPPACPGLDTLGWPYEGDVAAVSRALLDGEPVALWQDGDRSWPLPALPVELVDALPAAGPAILVTDRTDLTRPVPSVVLRPPSLTIGVGASRGVGAQEVLDLIRAALDDAGLSPASVHELATVDAKADEAGPARSRRNARACRSSLHPAEALAHGRGAEPQRGGPGRRRHPQRRRGRRPRSAVRNCWCPSARARWPPSRSPAAAPRPARHRRHRPRRPRAADPAGARRTAPLRRSSSGSTST